MYLHIPHGGDAGGIEVISLWVQFRNYHKVYGVHEQLLVTQSAQPTGEGYDSDPIPTLMTTSMDMVLQPQLKSSCNKGLHV